MSTKRNPSNLKKLVSSEEFDIKLQGSGVTIEGFANKATVDRGDEIIATDAWQLDNFKKNPVILFNHGMDSLGGTPIGKAIEIRQTDTGLFLKVKLSNSKAPGIQMVRDLVEERILKAFSVGFNPIETENLEMDGKTIRNITKAELFEVSIVGIPMNQDSLFELSEKALQTKSFHQIKGDILKAKGAEKAAVIEELLGEGDRKSIFSGVILQTKINHAELLDMLAGNAEIPDAVVEAFRSVTKQANLKEILEEALASLADGGIPETVAESLMSKLNGEPNEEAQEGEEDQPVEDGKAGEEDPKEEDGEGEGDKPGAEDAEGETDEGKEPPPKPEGSDDPKEDDDDSLKAEFQDCVAAMVPKLIEGGMEQDQAVAAAISKCQESGKCQLTPESKTALFEVCFGAVDAGTELSALSVLGSINFLTTDDTIDTTKQVDDSQQTDQAPTTPIKTEDAPEDFGSPQLEAAKQTNILLGALINEIQKLGAKIGSTPEQNSVQSEEVPPKEDDSSADEASKEAEDHAQKAIDSLNLRLKTLGF